VLSRPADDAALETKTVSGVMMIVLALVLVLMMALILVLVLVMVLVLALLGGKGWTSKDHQKQSSGKNHLHGTNVAR
jgi:flagellar basal body-associated protein FliL